MSTMAKAIVSRVMKNLGDRAGFDHWWDGISEDVQNERLDSLVQDVERELAPSLDEP